MRIISIASGKGGVGKTTITGAIGHMLAVLDKKVAVVDCNLTTPHLGISLGLEDSPITFNHVINKKAHVSDATYKHSTGFGVIPASIKLSDLGGVDFYRIREVIKKEYKDHFSQYDFVLLDCAPGLGREALAGLRASDESILVATPHLPSVMDVIKCKESLNQLGVETKGLVVNMVRGHKTELDTNYIGSLTKLPIISTIPMDNHVLHSLSHRTPISLYKPKSKASKNIYNIILHLLSD